MPRRDLALKRGALDALQLPIGVKHGAIRELRVKIPLAKLKSEGIVLTLSDVTAVVVPREEGGGGATRAERLANADAETSLNGLLKRQRLRAADLLRQQRLLADGDGEEEEEERTPEKRTLRDRLLRARPLPDCHTPANEIIKRQTDSVFRKDALDKTKEIFPKKSAKIQR